VTLYKFQTFVIEASGVISNLLWQNGKAKLVGSVQVQWMLKKGKGTKNGQEREDEISGKEEEIT
jgi:hypothetical protein